MLFYAFIRSTDGKYYDYLVTFNASSTGTGIFTYTSYGLGLYSSWYSITTPAYLIISPTMIYTAGTYITLNNVNVNYNYFGKYPATYYFAYNETITY